MSELLCDYLNSNSSYSEQNKSGEMMKKEKINLWQRRLLMSLPLVLPVLVFSQYADEAIKIIDFLLKTS